MWTLLLRVGNLDDYNGYLATVHDINFYFRCLLSRDQGDEYNKIRSFNLLIIQDARAC